MKDLLERLRLHYCHVDDELGNITCQLLAEAAAEIERLRSLPSYMLRGCVCPPTSEKTCETPTCPRKIPRELFGPSVKVFAHSS